MAPNLYKTLTLGSPKPKRPRTEKQKAAFEKARQKLAEKRQMAKQLADGAPTPNNSPKKVTFADEVKEEAVKEKVEEVKEAETTPEPKPIKVEPPPPPAKRKQEDDDDSTPPAWFKKFVKEARTAKLQDMKLRGPRDPPPRPPSPPSPSPPPRIKPRAIDRGIYSKIFPGRL